MQVEIDISIVHLIGRIGGEIKAYLRIVPPGIKYEGPSLGRVITATSIREQGYGKAILLSALDFVAQKYPNQEVSISAQYRLIKYYQKLGFKEVGEIYLEDDIDHIKMIMLPAVSKRKIFKTSYTQPADYFDMAGSSSQALSRILIFLL